MTNSQILDKTINFVKTQLTDAEGGHDWWHIERVWKLANHIAREEGIESTVIDLGSLLHDIADAKFHDGNEEIGPKVARDFLLSLEIEECTIDHIEKIIRNVSFKNANEQNFPVRDKCNRQGEAMGRLKNWSSVSYK